MTARNLEVLEGTDDGWDRLPVDQGQQARLTLVVGSPGAGQTALEADWLAARPQRPELTRPRGSSNGKLPDPLTGAEIRVLRSLPRRLTYADMATELHLSLNTVKTHLRHAYMKPGVNSRTAAVKRSATLGLL